MSDDGLTEKERAMIERLKDDDKRGYSAHDDEPAPDEPPAGRAGASPQEQQQDDPAT
ncbi:hypothetical protein [Nonomuraea maritima]|uniref:hypothetical protein n=1 Tax=Nonomuraea maritima TaxID=683260 RepID=UPI0037189ACC